jgi:predicted transcriptional regulator
MATQEELAYDWARREQGYSGTFAEWLKLSRESRRQYELGAAGIPTDADAV